MTINVTRLMLAMGDPMAYSASDAELGQNAGKITWRNACEDALVAFGDQFDREAFDDYFRHSGAWDDEEIAAHSDDECAALMLQFIAGDMREAECDNATFGSPLFDWCVYQDLAEAGTIGSQFYRAIDGTIYYSLEN